MDSEGLIVCLRTVGDAGPRHPELVEGSHSSREVVFIEKEILRLRCGFAQNDGSTGESANKGGSRGFVCTAADRRGRRSLRGAQIPTIFCEQGLIPLVCTLAGCGQSRTPVPTIHPRFCGDVANRVEKPFYLSLFLKFLKSRNFFQKVPCGVWGRVPRITAQSFFQKIFHLLDLRRLRRYNSNW